MMSRHQTRQQGFSILEVLVGMGILTAGVLAIMAIFPSLMQAQREAELLTTAATLAQMKAEEIRRDDSSDGKLVTAIKALTTPTKPIAFVTEPRLAYSFSGQTLLFTGQTGDPRATAKVARVIIRYAPSFKAGQDVLYELRFN